MIRFTVLVDLPGPDPEDVEQVTAWIVEALPMRVDVTYEGEAD